MCSSDTHVAGCQAGHCIQAIGCRAMEPRHPLAGARGGGSTLKWVGLGLLHRVHCAGSFPFSSTWCLKWHPRHHTISAEMLNIVPRYSFLALGANILLSSLSTSAASTIELLRWTAVYLVSVTMELDAPGKTSTGLTNRHFSWAVQQCETQTCHQGHTAQA